ncbi:MULTISPECIES: AAA family ATPase [Elizabethkingia]|uniref:AAA family ATPase n=1 Tax=Elizabethkingia TaxID=308865 RepID=UPI000999CBFD|nr:AAA family ATPase [Elizabethkingia anophelis]MBE9393265.1 AAA family ATPase [Elizabethkingia anophelis]MBE9406135.1 AAA family ATPase [Elizabethkingia anophelis]MCT4084928.1 ATP-binding protein [Elizabethkingia anophelis]MDV3586428.1 hypothetical protein [Elizabethkingia anophelis]MDV3713683.1 hypothetical protein [Elizabethkingia anophelis]
MIIGTIIRNIKTYSGINYVPLSFGQNFNGVVGNNGIGKSSILEALDCFFNSRSWNYNIITKKSGLSTTRPHIVPIFLFKISDIVLENHEIAKKLSDYVWQLEESDVLSQNRDQFKIFSEQLNILKRNYNPEDFLLLPIGITHDNNISLSIFNTKKLGELFVENFDKTQQVISDEKIKIFEPLLLELKNLIEYIYIPKDIDPDNFTQLETKEIQALMGETLIEIVEKCVPQGKIQEINRNLNTFIDNLTNVLSDYSFRTIGERQVNLRKHDVYKLIVEAYFKIRKLHKNESGHWLEMSVLSSGEKQKAIIELAYHFLKSYRQNTNKIILAIDEPESSLHMSACYDQFNKLFELCLSCRQLIFTTHWYGFIPTVEEGSVCVISKNDKHLFDLISVSNYREEVKQVAKISKGKLPYDIRLKSINDFTQSIITSILTNEPFNWLICEGSSEKIYFEKYFEDIKKEKKLRIIPVGGATEIKRIYNNLQTAYEDFKKEIKGKVILVSDTDSEIVQYNTKDDLKNLLCFRIVNNDKDKKTDLVKINSNPVSPKTEIEDSLNGKLFVETLLEFREENPDLDSIIEAIPNDVSEESSYYALDLSLSKQKKLDEFFNKNNNKFEFANKYVSKISDQFIVPSWIDMLKKLY